MRYGRARAAFERAVDALRIDIAYLELTPHRGRMTLPEAPPPSASLLRWAGRNRGARTAMNCRQEPLFVNSW
jgi:hypothetical protein